MFTFLAVSYALTACVLRFSARHVTARADGLTNTQLENQILAHARELRSRTLSQTQ